jgi:hypothetical protein
MERVAGGSLVVNNAVDYWNFLHAVRVVHVVCAMLPNMPVDSYD